MNKLIIFSFILLYEINIWALAPKSKISDFEIADIYFTYASELFLNGEKEAALIQYRLAYELNPDFFNRMFETANQSLRRVQFIIDDDEIKILLEMAYKIYDLHVLLFPERYQAHLGLGKVFFYQASYFRKNRMRYIEKAKEALRNSMEINNRDEEVWYYLGMVFLLEAKFHLEEYGMPHYYQLVAQGMMMLNRAVNINPKLKHLVDQILEEMDSEKLRIEPALIERVDQRLIELGASRALFNRVSSNVEREFRWVDIEETDLLIAS